MPTATSPATAYVALAHCADQIGAANFAKLPAKTRAAMTKGSVPTGVAWPTPAHRDVMDAMHDVMNDGTDVETAMALLHRSDVQKERYGR